MNWGASYLKGRGQDTPPADVMPMLPRSLFQVLLQTALGIRDGAGSGSCQSNTGHDPGLLERYYDLTEVVMYCSSVELIS
jgi:hypothetical protein